MFIRWNLFVTARVELGQACRSDSRLNVQRRTAEEKDKLVRRSGGCRHVRERVWRRACVDVVSTMEAPNALHPTPGNVYVVRTKMHHARRCGTIRCTVGCDQEFGGVNTPGGTNARGRQPRRHVLATPQLVTRRLQLVGGEAMQSPRRCLRRLVQARSFSASSLTRLCLSFNQSRRTKLSKPAALRAGDSGEALARVRRGQGPEDGHLAYAKPLQAAPDMDQHGCCNLRDAAGFAAGMDHIAAGMLQSGDRLTPDAQCA